MRKTGKGQCLDFDTGEHAVLRYRKAIPELERHGTDQDLLSSDCCRIEPSRHDIDVGKPRDRPRINAVVNQEGIVARGLRSSQHRRQGLGAAGQTVLVASILTRLAIMVGDDVDEAGLSMLAEDRKGSVFDEL